MTLVRALLTGCLVALATGSFAALELVQPAQTEETGPEASPDGVEEAPFAPTEPVTFEAPLTAGGAHVEGLTLEALITNGAPAFPPIAGLPAELWEGKSCATCHQWNRQELCDQGKRYLGAETDEAMTKEHPFGGGFKRNVRAWAENSCQ